MVFQQFAGINGVQFYASETFEAAGKLYASFTLFCVVSLSCETYSIAVMQEFQAALEP